MKQLLNEFRAFAVRGNMIDMAVGIIIGAAFGKIVSALVDAVIMPPLGLLIGGVDFSDLKITLQSAENGAAEVAIRYGQFLQTLFDFTIIAFAIFMMLKGINRLRAMVEKQEAQKPAEPAPTPADIQLLTEIRDLLKKK